MIAMILIAQLGCWTPKGLVGDLHLWFNTPYVAKDKKKCTSKGNSSSSSSGSTSQKKHLPPSLGLSFTHVRRLHFALLKLRGFTATSQLL